MTPSAAASRRTCALALAVALLAAGCATPPPAERNMAQGPWSGRLALRLDGTPPQSFTAAFELKGRAELAEFALVRRGNRLSVLPVTRAQWDFILDLE